VTRSTPMQVNVVDSFVALDSPWEMEGVSMSIRVDGGKSGHGWKGTAFASRVHEDSCPRGE